MELKIKDVKQLEFILFLKEMVKKTVFEGHIFLVGGYVRDCILEKTPHDIDIAVDIPNGGVGFAMWLAYNTGCFTNGTNPVIFSGFGTAKLRITSIEQYEGIEIECVQTRKEQYHKESRNPSTVFGTIEEDASRRDFTINALYYDISNDRILDPTHKGFSDLASHIIRSCGKPDIIFEDDPLRIIRAIRFSTQLGWKIEKDTWTGMIVNSKRLLILSQERVTDELNKILLCKNPSNGINKMLLCGILDKVLPAVSQYRSIFQTPKAKYTLYEHTLNTLDKTQPILINRLAALFHDIGKLFTYEKGFLFHSTIGADKVKELLIAMKYSKDVSNKVSTIVEHHEDFSCFNSSSTPGNAKIRKFSANFEDEDTLMSALDVINADVTSQYYTKKVRLVPTIQQRLREMKEKGESINKIVLPVNGNDIMNEFNLKSGPFIGTLLDEIKKKVLEKPDLTKNEAFQAVENYIKKVV